MARIIAQPDVQLYFAQPKEMPKLIWAKALSAVITVPAYFNDAQRQATKDAVNCRLEVCGSSMSQQLLPLPMVWIKRNPDIGF